MVNQDVISSSAILLANKLSIIRNKKKKSEKPLGPYISGGLE
jgi:hypothetical protein